MLPKAERAPVFGKNALAGGGAVLLLLAIWWSPWWGSHLFNAYQTSCGGLVSSVVATSKDNASVFTPAHLIDVVEIEALEATDTRTNCAGIGIFSDGAKLPINFAAYEEYGKWWVTYELQ